MNAGALVFCLLDAEAEYTPEGYSLLSTARVGEYELRLWRGKAHVKGEPLQFNEVSLNAVGHKFDPESQRQKFKGSIHGLGKRGELLYTVAGWIKKFGDLYVGSYVPKKLSIYHQLFKRYLPQFNVSNPYAPFDECEGVPEYFHVTAGHGVVESILQESMLTEAERYLNALPSVEEQAAAKAIRIVAGLKDKGLVNEDNFGDTVEGAVNEVVYDFGYATGNEVVDISFFNNVMTRVLCDTSRK